MKKKRLNRGSMSILTNPSVDEGGKRVKEEEEVSNPGFLEAFSCLA